MHGLGEHGNYDGPRNQVCPLELWENALGLDKNKFNQQRGAEICGIMKKMNGWGLFPGDKRGRKDNLKYGRQTTFVRL